MLKKLISQVEYIILNYLLGVAINLLEVKDYLII